MEQTLVLEIRGKDGSLKERRKLQCFPATIGRAYSNDIIIDDPYVCANHLRIDERGEELVLQDISAVNGMYLISPGKKVTEVTLSPGITVRMGQTTVRFYPADHKVDPARVHRSERRVFFGLAKPRIALLSFLLLVSFQVVTGHATTYQKERHHGLLYILLYELAFDLACLLPWAGLWSMVSRIVVHHAHFLAHLVAATIGLLLLEVTLFCGRYLIFATNAPWASVLFLYLPAICIITIQLANHAKLSSRVTVRRSSLIASGVTLLIFGIYGAFRFAETTKYNANLPLNEALKPPAFDWAGSVSVDEFVSETAAINQELELLAKDEE